MITYKQSVIVLFIVVFQKDVVILHLFIARVTSVTITLMPALVHRSGDERHNHFDAYLLRDGDFSWDQTTLIVQ